ncbi:hypothetical protein JI721_12275 [Alicyclobacillus cycloheptanicus]|uniref:Small-conductance mechanosensitive channel n=1 Tax=Alicyclobacillus cycloheptanicus TaxID=1457 RepID=A0ABT9XFM0_9BACL|nr:hypothetical protein [Alicyclobacillus cycloheptanicus]MDQ0188869.1 small-conductance mechanosensitive channel [Alicyclobacillus cycloheptanicus]WDM00489.1 hypothetical protein JI721_12275 [Alicyclobacillus cycloheptanicus]
MVRNPGKADVGLVGVWVLTVLVWLFTWMAAFAVRTVEAQSILVIAIVYSILHRLKRRYRPLRLILPTLLLLAVLCAVMLVFDIMSAVHAAPRP